MADLIYTSVVLAVYNGEDYIEKQLISIYQQTEQPDEVIISDDGSKDRTVEIVQNFIRNHNLDNWKIIVNKNDKGVRGNFKNAITHCKGELIFLCDQDDIWFSDKIEYLSLKMRKEDFSCIISSIKYIDSEDKIISLHTPFTVTKTHEVSFEELLTICSYLGMTAVFRRKVFFNVNKLLWNSTSHDWAMFIESLHDGRILFDGKCLQYHRVHSNNASELSGKNAKIKRINLLKRQIQHISNVVSLPWLSIEQQKSCLAYINFLNKRIVWITRGKIVKIILHIKKYRDLGYTYRNIVADINVAILGGIL